MRVSLCKFPPPFRTLAFAALSRRARLGASGIVSALVLIAALAMQTAPAAAASLLNGGFETPDLGDGTRFSFVDPASVEGWETTDSAIEIWANGFNGVPSYEGTQHAEINARAFGTLYQTVGGIVAGADLVFEFAHRARQGTDTMRVDLLDLGGDDIAGTSDDTLLFSNVFSATTEAWILSRSSSFADIAALGGDVRLSFTALTTGSGSVSVGNFLDGVRLYAELPSDPVPPMPGPATGLLLVGALGALSLWRRRKA